MYIIIIIVYTISLLQIVKNYSRIKRYDQIDSDTYSHLRIASEFVQLKSIISYHGCYYPGRKLRYTYPPILHIILAILQKPFSLLLRKSVSIWLNILSSILFGLSLKYIYGFPGYDALLGCGLLCLVMGLGDDMRPITPRAIGIILLFLVVTGIHKYTFGLTNYSLLIVISSTLLYLSHRMGTQVMIYLHLLLIIVSIFNPEIRIAKLLLLQLFSSLLAILLTRGQALHLFRDHWYRVYLHIMYGDQWDGGKKLGNPRKIIKQNPLILVFGWILMIKIFNDSIFDSIHNNIIVYTIFLLIFLSVFWVWGSGTRHIIFASPFIILMYLSLDKSLVTYLALLIPILYSMKELIERNDDNELKLDKERIEIRNITDALQQIPGKKVLILPNVLITYLVYWTDKIFISGSHDSSALTFNRFQIKRRLGEHGYIVSLIKELKPDIILLKRSYNNPEMKQYLSKEYTVYGTFDTYSLIGVTNMKES
jgi:hypothetical protein